VTRVPTEQADWALRRLTARTAEYLHTPPIPVASSRHAPERLTTRDANAIVDLVAVAESFCVARLNSIGIGADVNTWDKRSKAWLKRSVDFDGYPGWPLLMGFVEVRNAVQHGLGRLTDRQLGKHKTQILGWLAAAAVRLNGDGIILGPDDVARCDRTCVEFVRWLDTSAPTPTR
jgi:hypothetical protein